MIVAAACLTVPSLASAFVTTTPSGHRLSVMLRKDAKQPNSNGSKGSGGVLQAHGGPVLTSSSPYLIYWTPPGYSISGASESLMNQYLTDVAAASSTGSTTNVFSVLGQYGAPYKQTFVASSPLPGASQAVTDMHPYPTKQTGCTVSTGTTACVTDASIQAEISSLINAGTLPAPTTAGGTASDPIFFMITPVNVNVCLGGNTCSSNNFCAYHDDYALNGKSVLYASVPFSVFATSTKGCQTDQYSSYNTPVGPSGDQAYNVADDLSHELSETITDPLINAWYAGNGLEVADLCEAYAARASTLKGVSPLAYAPASSTPSGGIYDQLINGDEYYNQTEYSNSAGQCETGTTSLG